MGASTRHDGVWSKYIAAIMDVDARHRTCGRAGGERSRGRASNKRVSSESGLLAVAQRYPNADALILSMHARIQEMLRRKGSMTKY